MIKKDINFLMREYEKTYNEKESKLKKSLERATKALHCKAVDRVPVIQTSRTILYPRHEIFYSCGKNLISQLANIILTIKHETDYIPFLDPFEGVTIMAEAFGCHVTIPENGDPVIKTPIIRKPEDVYEIKKPKLDNPVYTRVFETLKFFGEKTGCLIPLGPTDPQGPLSIASLIWDSQDFLISCIKNKKEVHYILNIITESFIEFYKAQYDIIKNKAFPVHSFPLINISDGISISDDESILLSPQLFQEFGIPYLNKISESFGGLYYHTCGDFGHILDDVLSINNLRAINIHLSPCDAKPEYIKKIVSKGIGLYLGLSDREIGWQNPKWGINKSNQVYEKYYLPSAIRYSGGNGITLVGYGSYSGYINMSEKDRNIDELFNGDFFNNQLVNLSLEKKNENFHRVILIIEKEMKKTVSDEFNFDKDYYLYNQK